MVTVVGLVVRRVMYTVRVRRPVRIMVCLVMTPCISVVAFTMVAISMSISMVAISMSVSVVSISMSVSVVAISMAISVTVIVSLGVHRCVMSAFMGQNLVASTAVVVAQRCMGVFVAYAGFIPSVLRRDVRVVVRIKVHLRVEVCWLFVVADLPVALRDERNSMISSSVVWHKLMQRVVVVVSNAVSVRRLMSILVERSDSRAEILMADWKTQVVSCWDSLVLIVGVVCLPGLVDGAVVLTLVVAVDAPVISVHVLVANVVRVGLWVVSARNCSNQSDGEGFHLVKKKVY